MRANPANRLLTLLKSREIAVCASTWSIHKHDVPGPVGIFGAPRVNGVALRIRWRPVVRPESGERRKSEDGDLHRGLLKQDETHDRTH